MEEHHDAAMDTTRSPRLPSSSVERGPRSLAIRVSGWILVAALVVIPTFGRVSWELAAERELAAAADSIGERITHLGRAARWKLPLATGDDAAVDELEQLGREHAAKAETDVEARLVALASLREARAAILARRGPIQWSAERTRLHELDVAIAALMALEEQRWYGPRHAKDAAWHLERLEVASSRTRPFAFAAAIAFLIFVAGLVVFLLRGLDDSGLPRRPWGWMWLTVTVSAAMGWLTLLGRDEPVDGPRVSVPGDRPARTAQEPRVSGKDL